METIHICGFESCVFFYKACIYASYLKKKEICKDYIIKSFQTNEEYKQWLVEFKTQREENIKLQKHMTSPLVWTADKIIGGCSDIEEIVHSTTSIEKNIQ